MINYRINELDLGEKSKESQRVFQFEFQHNPENNKEMTRFVFYLTEEELKSFTKDLISLTP